MFCLHLPLRRACFLQASWVGSSENETCRTSFCEGTKGFFVYREIWGQSQITLTVFLARRGMERARKGPWGQLGTSPRVQSSRGPGVGSRQRSGWKRERAWIWQRERFRSRWSFPASQVWLLCLNTLEYFCYKPRKKHPAVKEIMWHRQWKEQWLVWIKLNTLRQ